MEKPQAICLGFLITTKKPNTLPILGTKTHFRHGFGVIFK